MKQQPLRIRQMQLLVVPDDLLKFVGQFTNLERFAPLQVSLAEGSLRLTGRYRLALFQLPVDLTFRVAGIRPDLLDLSVTAGHQSDDAMILDVLAGIVQGARIGGLTMQGSHLLINTVRLGALLGLAFRLRSVAFTPSGILMEAADFDLPPPPPPVRAQAPVRR